MKFETLKSFNKKKVIIPIVIISCLIIVITIFVSHSKYISKDSITIMDDEVNYKPYDFKIIGIYQQKETCEDPSSEDCYEKKNVIPTTGYKINQDKTYCYIDDENNKIKNKIYTDDQGQHVIGDLNIRSKCYLYFDKAKEETSKNTFEQLMGLSAKLESKGRIDLNGIIDVEREVSEGIVYEAPDDDGTSYYYRGDVQDNYVKFGKTGATPNEGTDIWWRIIRINGDGSIRMIYAGTGSEVPSQKNNSVIVINDGKKYPFNSSSYNAECVGYQYTSGVRNGHTTDSNAKTVLETWFAENLLDEFDLEDSKIDRNAGFCGDRSAYSSINEDTKDDSLGTGNQSTFYGAYIRNYMQKAGTGKNNILYAHPSLECPDVTNDLFTFTGSNKGTQSLKYPIGLVTADEVTYAGGLFDSNSSNSNYYLYGELYWTMSPASRPSGSTSSPQVFVVLGGYLAPYNAGQRSSVALRPVINLTSDSIISGKGTSTDPYKTVND